MTLTFEQKLQNYADLTVQVGVNLQAGQQLMIRAPLGAAPLVRLIAASAYKVGCPLVNVVWQDEQLTLTRFQHAPRDSFSEYPVWQAEALIASAKRGEAMINILASDPDLLKDQDPDLVALVNRAQQEHLAEFYSYIMRDALPWTVISVPVPIWAAKMFPDKPRTEQVEHLWETIFQTCRLDQVDPVSAWQEQSQKLKNWREYLTTKQYTALKYTGPGTDLTLGLPPNHIWKGGSTTSPDGIPFIPNMPTEEVFTLPHREQAEGYVISSKPLNYGGTLIENFTLTFAEGRIVKATAKKGKKVLQNLINTDEGASRLGEIALVPHSSPISQSGLLFYNTLFDENAASHLAIGQAYRFTLAEGTEMNKETFAAAGGNSSLTHVDFMIGNGELDIDGVLKNGSVEPVMRQGEWAF